MRTIECPQCGTDNQEGNHLCSNCGYPLSWAEEKGESKEITQPDMSVEPGVESEPEPEHEWATPVYPKQEGQKHRAPAHVAPPSTPQSVPAEPGITCSVCSTRNSLERTYCMRCGALLVETPPVPTTPQRQRPRIPRNALIVGVVGVVALAAALLVTRPWSSGEDPTVEGGGTTVTADSTQGSTSTTESPEPVLIDPAIITASADPTGSPGNRTSYEASNMLDGVPSTAWNHCNADRDSNQPCATTGGVGSVLTFRFARPIDLSVIEISNGYNKMDDNNDRFIQNARIESGTIITEAGEFELSLLDDRTPQRIENNYGLVSEVRIKVATVYRGTKYQDLAVSEVKFYGVEP